MDKKELKKAQQFAATLQELIEDKKIKVVKDDNGTPRLYPV